MTGYYRYSTIHENKIAFISEDDIWLVTLENLNAVRLTSNISQITCPAFSPNGKLIAFIGTEDGNTEIYTMPSIGGQATRLTYDGAYISKIALWNKKSIYYTSTLDSPFQRVSDLRQVSCDGGNSIGLNYGMATNISISNNGVVLGKNTADPARWKRYKGGTAGEMLIDTNNNGIFKKFLNINGNIASPMWIGDNIYFLSDHEGISNLYSSDISGNKLNKLTNHENYYARNATTDGKMITYHSGGDIYVYDVLKSLNQKLEIIYNSPKVDVGRKFIPTYRYLESCTLSNDKNHISFISRGKCLIMGTWNGPVAQLGAKHGVRYKHAKFLQNDKKILIISDKSNKENIEVYNISSNTSKIYKSNCGRITNVKKSPVKDEFIFINHKHELHLFKIKDGTILKIDRSEHDFIQSNWSPCGNFITYNCSISPRCSIIKIYDIKRKKIFNITSPVNKDSSPSFDSSGKYLTFISTRIFKPSYDTIQFDLSFQNGEKPYMITLSKDTQSPFLKDPNNENSVKDKTTDKKDEKKKSITTKIDFKNIENRIMEIPVSEGVFSNTITMKDSKIYYIADMGEDIDEDSYLGNLKYYDLDLLEEKSFMSNILSFEIFDDKILIDNSKSLRLLSLSSPPSKDILQAPKCNSKTGLINLNRAKIEIDPISEWKQMYAEAWRLQRDHFWDPNMSGIDWNKVYDRYYILINRLGSRFEFSDLVWEMQGELGTSHCYEMGGDYKPKRYYLQGHLGSKILYDPNRKAYQLNKIYKGDLWDNPQSPLLRPGLNISEGDYLTKINGNKLTKIITPGHSLLNMPNTEVSIEVSNKSLKKKRTLTVKTLSSQKRLQYRDWVEYNKEYTHKKSKGKIGYLHIPDMGVDGFAEFHRYFLSEIAYDGLIVDVRYNGGGHISQLLLSKLAKKRLGFDLTRWMGIEAYPSESPAGPMVAITNEFAGSDGDIFSHSWKMMNLGKLIGKRTWGGVIGIWPRNSLVDGTMTSQPEFSFWFKDVGWGIENYGAEVDIEIDNFPQDYVKNIDNQLDKGIEIVLKDLKTKGSVLRPDFNPKPSLKLP